MDSIHSRTMDHAEMAEKPENSLSVEEVGAECKAGAEQKGGTAADESEMQRMGKAQELRVGNPQIHRFTV